MTILYHYSALRGEKVGAVAYASGVIETSQPISTPELYFETCKRIAESRDWEADAVVILSLNRLGASDDER